MFGFIVLSFGLQVISSFVNIDRTKVVNHLPNPLSQNSEAGCTLHIFAAQCPRCDVCLRCAVNHYCG